ncbi:MAG: hypothetical protein UV08_C0012G0001, partial [Parcubacteria group bacterium GW2011_GWA2_42_18]
QSITNFFSSVSDKIVNGISYFKDIFTDNLTIGSLEKRAGITLYDELSGEPFCVSFSGGEVRVLIGKCS